MNHRLYNRNSRLTRVELGLPLFHNRYRFPQLSHVFLVCHSSFAIEIHLHQLFAHCHTCPVHTTFALLAIPIWEIFPSLTLPLIMQPLEPRPPSSTLPWPFPSGARGGVTGAVSGLFWRLGSRAVISSVSIIGGVWLRYINQCQIHNLDAWVSLVSSFCVYNLFWLIPCLSVCLPVFLSVLSLNEMSQCDLFYGTFGTFPRNNGPSI